MKDYIINSNKDEIKQEGNIINDSKVSYEGKKETFNQINSFEAEIKQHHFPNLIQIKNRKKIIIIQI